MDLFQLTYFIEVAHKKASPKLLNHCISASHRSARESRPWKNTGASNSSTARGKCRAHGNGVLFAPQNRRAHQGIHQLNEEMESPQLLNAGKLSVGVPPMIGSSVIAPFIAHFINKYPKIELEMKEVGSQDVVSAIDDGLIQVGFVALPITTEIPYEFFIFHEEPLDVVLWPDHPWPLGRR